MATTVVPPEIQNKVNAVRKFISCPYCAVVESEKNSGRKCFENADFIAFTPYAPRFNYEIWILPKQHISRLENVNFAGLAEIVSMVLRKVHEGNLDYNMMVQYSPKGEDLHLHIEVCPRSAIWAGFELGSGIIINSVSPEDAAKWYRGEE